MAKRRRKTRLLLVLAAILVALFLLRSLWFGPLAGGLAPAIAPYLGFKFEADDIVGDGTSYLELSEVRISALVESQSIRRLDARTIKLQFSLIELLTEGLVGLVRVESDGLDLEIDFERGADSEQPDEEESPGDSSSKLALPSIELEDSRVLLQFDEETMLEFRGAELLATRNADAITLKSDECNYGDGQSDQASGSLSTRLLRSAGGVVIERLDWGEQLSLRNSTFNWSDADTQGLSWDLKLQALDGNAELAGEFDGDRELKLKVDAAQLDLSMLVHYLPSASTLSGRVRSMVGEVSYSFGPTARLTGQFETAIRELSFADFEAMDLNGKLSIEDGFIRSELLELKSEANALTVTKVELPIQLGSPLEQLRRGRFDLQVDAANLPKLLGRPDEELGYNDHRLELFMTLDKGSAVILRGQLTTEGGLITVKSGTIRETPENKARVELELFADFEDLAPFGQLFGEAPWSGNLAGQVLVGGDWPALSATAELDGEQTRIAGIDLGQVEVRLEIDREHIVIPRLESRSGGNELALSGAIKLVDRNPSFENLEFDLNVGELSRLLPGLDVAGKLRIQGQARGAVGELNGDWSLSAEELRIDGHALDQFSGRGVLSGDQLGIEDLNFSSSGAVLSLAGELLLDPGWSIRTLNLKALSLERGEQTLDLQRSTSVSFENTWPNFRALDLKGSAGSLALYCQTEEAKPTNEQQSPTLRIGLKAENFAPMQLIEPFLSERYVLDGIDGSLDARLVDNQLEFSSELRIEQFELPLAELTGTNIDHPWSINWKADLKDDVLIIERFEALSGEASQLRLSGRLPLQPLSSEILREGALQLSGELSLPELNAFRALVPEDKPWPKGQLALLIDLAGSWERPEGSIELDAERIELSLRGEELFSGAELGGRIQLGSKTVLEQIRILVPDALSLNADGELDQTIDLRSLANGVLPISEDTPIQFAGNVNIEDSTWLNRLHRTLDGGFLRRFGGQVAAELELTGTIGEPIPRAQLELSDGEFKLSPELPAIENLSAVIAVDRGRFEVSELRGELGGDSFLVAGHVDLDSTPPILDLALSGKNLLFYRSTGVKVRSNAELTITGTPTEPKISGELQLTDSRFVKRFDFLSMGEGNKSLDEDRTIPLFAFRDEPLASTLLDVRITAESPVRIDNNVVKARIRPDLRLAGRGELPELFGVLYVDGGKVSLPANDLYLRPGTIRFERNLPMIPQLELLLQNRIRGYEVTVAVNGSYDDPEVNSSSIPPLGPEDLAGLIWAGQDPGEGLSSRTGVAGAQAVGVFIAQDLLTRIFSNESTESDEAFLDRFELHLGRDTTIDGGETVEMTYRIAEKVLGDSDTVYLATERDIYAYVNFGIRFVFRFN